MGPASRRTTDTLERQLFREGFQFEFFQAVRLLHRVYPDKGAIGTATKPSDEVVRIGCHVSLEFPASPIHEILEQADPAIPTRMAIAFFGLMGTQGVLPLHYTEWMVAREAAKDTAMAAFLNIFNHRWTSLFYKAWEKHRLPIAYERSALEPTAVQRINNSLFDLIGLGTKGLRDRLRFSDETLLYYAGLIAQRPRSVTALRGILRDYFGVAVVIRQCLGSWYPLERKDRCYLDCSGPHNQLGEGAVAGDAVWDQQSRFAIRLGPLRADRFRAFLPSGRAMKELADLTRFFIGLSAVFSVQLVLDARDVPGCQLLDESETAPRLGWNTWLKTGEFLRHPDDAIFAEAA